MELFEKAKIIMLPTKNGNRLLYLSKDVMPNLLSNWRGEAQELYFISDEPIKEKDWIIVHTHLSGYRIKQVKEIKSDILTCTDNELLSLEFNIKKIIATTDYSLTVRHDCNCFATTFEGCSECIGLLPQPNEQFIKLFIESFNNSEIIVDVLVEYEPFLTEGWVPTYNNPDNFNLEEPAEIDYQIKLSENNTIIIKL